MPDIGQKITQARKASGMTQEELAAVLSVSRSTVSNWEAGRRLPDVVMLMRLSEVLDCNFDEKTAPVQKDAEENKTEAKPEPANEPEEEQKTAPGRKIRIIAAAVLAMILIAVFAVTAAGKKPNIRSYTAMDGTVWTPEDFRKEAQYPEGQPLLKVTTVLKTVSGEGTDYVQYEFVFRNEGGQIFFIDLAETVVFSVKGVNQPYQFPADSLEQFGLAGEIAPGDEWSFSGGCPAQDGLWGVGTMLTGRNENGEEMRFTAYQPLQ